MARRGFTILELLVAMTMSAVVATAAISATVALQRSFAGARDRLARVDDARLLLEPLVDRVRLAGGGLVRPWQAISVSCAPDGRQTLPVCDPADRRRHLHFLELESAGQGIVDGVVGGSVTVRLNGGACPLSAENGFSGRTDVVLVPPERHLAALGGAVWLTASCDVVSPCGCALSNIGLTGFNPPPATAIANVFVGGVIARGVSTSIFVVPETGALTMLRDFNGGGVANRVTLGPRARHFDVRLGYDLDGDGDIDSVVADPDLARQGALRTVRLGLGLGQPAKDGLAEQAPLFGATVGQPGEHTIVVEATAVPRATGVFQ